MEKEAAGEPIIVPFKPDERVLRPRVAGFLAVGGALTPQWHTLAQPMMQTLAFSMRCGIVDQAILSGSGTPRSIVLDDAALDRARQLGRAMAQQLGRSFEDVEYRGGPGLCPLCHLSLISVPRRGRGVRRLRRRGPRRAARWAAEVPLLTHGAGEVRPAPVEKRAHCQEIPGHGGPSCPLAAKVQAGAAPFTDGRVTAWCRREPRHRAEDQDALCVGVGQPDRSSGSRSAAKNA